MKRLLSVFTIALLSRGALGQSNIIDGKVIHVDDGDTVILFLEDHRKMKVRLSDIDAPEITHGKERPGQPYSAQSRQFLERLTYGKLVSVHCYEIDRYGRQVCQITAGDVNVNTELVKNGFAWANRANLRYVRDKSIFDAENFAQKNKLGMWASQKPQIEPWVWRKSCWQFGICAD